MLHRVRTYGLLVLLSLTTALHAQPLSDEARISLLTCTPGEELYARYGHTAIRVCDPQRELDLVFNYGIFDFNTDHFYWKFVRGETWYELGATRMTWFISEYEIEQRPVYEQVLRLDSTQREAIWQALLINYQPANRQYLYNFVFDNCATRPYWLIRKALGGDIRSSYSGNSGQTYRRFLRQYTGAHTWANAGINLLFGPRADQPMSDQQRLFLPEELMCYMDEATLADGSPLLLSSNSAPFQAVSTPWYATWELGLVLYLLLIALLSLYDRHRQRWSWWVELVVGVPYLLLLLIVTFLTFFSCHPLVGFGWRLMIIPLTHLCARLIYILR